jgi:hypothetical protein
LTRRWKPAALYGGLLFLSAHGAPAPSLALDLANGEAAKAALTGATAFETGVSYRPWRQYFAPDGSTIYFGKDGPSSQGSWDMRGDQYCSVWPPATQWVCYSVIVSKDAQGRTVITWIGADGERSAGTLVPGNQLDKRALPD